MPFELINQSQTPSLDFSKKFDRVQRLPISEKINAWSEFEFVIVGIGGIGFHVAKAIAQTLGEPRLTLIDREMLEEENLNRFDVDVTWVGTQKVDVASQIIAMLNLSAKITTYNADFREVKDTLYANSYSVIIDEVDSASMSREIYEFAKKKEAIYVSMKYNGFDRATLYVNEIGFDTGLDNPYEIFPSAYFSAVIFANLLVYYLFSHYPDEIRDTHMIKNIRLSEVLGVE